MHIFTSGINQVTERKKVVCFCCGKKLLPFCDVLFASSVFIMTLKQLLLYFLVGKNDFFFGLIWQGVSNELLLSLLFLSIVRRNEQNYSFEH